MALVLRTKVQAEVAAAVGVQTDQEFHTWERAVGLEVPRTPHRVALEWGILRGRNWRAVVGTKVLTASFQASDFRNGFLVVPTTMVLRDFPEVILALHN